MTLLKIDSKNWYQ